MPYSDIRTGKIYGCEENTFSWWHEKGHLAFTATEEGTQSQYMQNSSLVITIAFLLLTQFISIFKYLALVSFAVYIYCFISEEVWCNKYGKDKMNQQLTNPEVQLG